MQKSFNIASRLYKRYKPAKITGRETTQINSDPHIYIARKLEFDITALQLRDRKTTTKEQKKHQKTQSAKVPVVEIKF